MFFSSSQGITKSSSVDLCVCLVAVVLLLVFADSNRMQIFLIGLFIQLTFSENPILKTSSGIYRGEEILYHQQKLHRYLGIRYARVLQRFARAQPIDHHLNDSILDGTQLGPICKSSGRKYHAEYGISSLVSPIVDEQCLVLNLFIPIDQTNESKAILLWIHGGSTQDGSGNLFDGTILAARGDFILVTFNYRLSLFGFLSTGDDELEGNLGLYDQALVLDWIEKNADEFHGDRKRITVAGHSAGASHAYFLALSPLNRGRIRRLILQSGSPWNHWAFISSARAKKYFENIVEQNGCDEENRLKCLREIDFRLLFERDELAYNTAEHTNVVLHGEFFREFQRELNGEDRLGEIDLMIGSNDDEGIFFAMIPIQMENSSNINLTSIALKFLSAMRPHHVQFYDQILNLYKISSNCQLSYDCYCSRFYNYSRLISDVLFNHDYYRFLLHRLRLNKRTYVYRYSYRTSMVHPSLCHSYLQHVTKFVGHFAELEYLWAVPLLLQTNINRIQSIQYRTNSSIEKIRFSEDLIDRWSNFILYGNAWKSIEDGWILNLRENHSDVEPFHLPSTIEFWLTSASISFHSTLTIIIIIISVTTFVAVIQ